MKKLILLTGGAGFIGSHVADELINHGYAVRLLDNLSAHVHGQLNHRPAFLSRHAELTVGDIRDTESVRRALKGVDAVCHLASAVGVGQSMLDIREYTTTNNLGTAVLMDALVEHPVERLVVASGQVVYGEGTYRSRNGIPVLQPARTAEQLRAGNWDVIDESGSPLECVATPESTPPSLSSVYALSKFDQEQMCQIMGSEYGISTVVLRIFSVYGTRQFLLNPHLGVLSIFASQLINSTTPVIYEDGNQMRDFIDVRDVARAFRLALESAQAGGQTINLGTGKPHSILTVAGLLSQALARRAVKLKACQRQRKHDVRHCFADTSLARKLLGFEAGVRLDEGIAKMAAWIERHVPYDRGAARFELAS
jgi:dTDP-L-rhamnose 4-epimerase